MTSSFDIKQYNNATKLCVTRGYQAGMRGDEYNPYKGWYTDAAKSIMGIDAMFHPTDEEVLKKPIVTTPLLPEEDSEATQANENKLAGLTPLQLFQSLYRQIQSLHLHRLCFRLSIGPGAVYFVDSDAASTLSKAIEGLLESTMKILKQHRELHQSEGYMSDLLSWYSVGTLANKRAVAAINDDHWANLMAEQELQT